MYIEREAVLNRLFKVAVTDDTFGMGIQCGVNHAVDVVKEAPAADVAPVVHGKWIEELEIGYDGSCNGVHNRCSACSEWFYGVADFNYCPNCGAKLDGERKENNAELD